MNENKEIPKTEVDLIKIRLKLGDETARIWKGKRLYLDRGYNTKKVKTTCYIYMLDGKPKVNVSVECNSQNLEWCYSQKEKITEDVEREIQIAFETNTYYIQLPDGKYVDSDGAEVDSIEDGASGFDLEGQAKGWNRSEYDCEGKIIAVKKE